MVPRRRWIVWSALALGLLALAAAWRFTPLREWADVDAVAAAVQPYRSSWIALPATIVVFVVLELVLFPVLVLVFACGIVFGPWLGAVYALAGAVASALIPFAIGRRLGRARIERTAGPIVRRFERVLDRKGIIAVFLVRKVPAPFTLANVVCGAFAVTWTDFVLGTVLGMGTGVILITVLGGQLLDLVRNPEPAQIGLALLLLAAPLVLALLSQRLLNKRRAEQP